MEKFVLEKGIQSSMYVGFVTDSRTLYNTYEEAKAEYDRIIKESYNDVSKEEMEEIQDECEGICCGDADYLDDWTDEENDIYLRIYSVKEGK